MVDYCLLRIWESQILKFSHKFSVQSQIEIEQRASRHTQERV